MRSGQFSFTFISSIRLKLLVQNTLSLFSVFCDLNLLVNLSMHAQKHYKM